jgi:hypothetical protein
MSSISKKSEHRHKDPRGKKRGASDDSEEGNRMEEEEVVVVPQKKTKKSKASESTSIGRLTEFREKSHWTNDIVVNSFKEPARGKATTRDLLVVSIYLPNNKSGKVGPGGRYNLVTREGICLFLTEEYRLRRFGIVTMTTGMTSGAKFLLDVTETEDSAVNDLPREVMKLAKEVGWEITRLGDPRKSIKMVAKLPPWESVQTLAEALEKEDWVEKLEDAKRVRLCGGMVTTEHVTFQVTPAYGAKLPVATLTGSKEEEGPPMSEDLLTSAKWGLKVAFMGYNVLFTRMSGCSYCGQDDHLVGSCILAVNMAAEDTSNHCFRKPDLKGKGRAVTPPPIREAPRTPKKMLKVKKAKKGGKVGKQDAAIDAADQ